jgi:dihydroorotase-like cyclic amidohydrolase
MKPPLGTRVDQEALWRGIVDGTIDVIETDHAPHLLSEKEAGTAKFGVPGLETALGLMARAAREGRINKEDIPRLMYENPKRIFKIPDQHATYIEVDFERSFIVRDEELETRSKWSPFAGWELPGVVETVVLCGKTIVREGRVV